MAQENKAQDLSDFLQTHNFDVTYKGANGMDSAPKDARTFAFDWIGPSGKNYGTVAIVLGDENELLLFFGDNMGKTMDNPEDKIAWLGDETTQGFLTQVKDFATRHNVGTFTTANLTQLKNTMAGIAAIKEGLFEGYYGNRKVSYMGEVTDARLVIKHNRMIGENDKRYRYVESLYIETAEGERFKLPFTKLAGGRALLEHVRQGGNPYDIRGQHIKDMVNEMNLLARFNRASQNKIFEAQTAELVESARSYYVSLKEGLAHLATSRGYREYFESWSPADTGSEDALVENIKTMFIEQTLDARIEAVVPILARLQQGAKMKEVQVFESWIDRLTEGTWALPDTPEAQAKLTELMSQELIVGPDAINATEQLYDVVGDDQLFDILKELADKDPRANIWEDTDVQTRLAELGIQTPASSEVEPADVAQDTAPAEPIPQQVTQPVAEGVLMDERGETLDHILNRFKYEVRQFEQNGDLDDDLYHALFDYFSDAGEIPYGVAKARTGDPHNWIADKLGQHLHINEAMPLDTFEMGVMGPAMGGQMVGVGEGAQCNMTAEGEYCPEHGLAECGYMESMGGTVAGAVAPVMDSAYDDPINANSAITGSYYESQDPLARIKALALSRR